MVHCCINLCVTTISQTKIRMSTRIFFFFADLKMVLPEETPEEKRCPQPTILDLLVPMGTMEGHWAVPGRFPASVCQSDYLRLTPQVSLIYPSILGRPWTMTHCKSSPVKNVLLRLFVSAATQKGNQRGEREEHVSQCQVTPVLGETVIVH